MKPYDLILAPRATEDLLLLGRTTGRPPRRSADDHLARRRGAGASGEDYAHDVPVGAATGAVVVGLHGTSTK